MRLLNYLTESTFDVEIDVDWIYETYFSVFIDLFQRKEYNRLYQNAIKFHSEFSSSKLKSPDCIKAHEINPITIICEYSDKINSYQTISKKIYLILYKPAIDVLYNTGEDYKDRLTNKVSIYTLENFFNKASVKATIAHELTHWIDDSLHNFYIYKNANKQDKFKTVEDFILSINRGKSKLLTTTPIELNAQVTAFREFLRSFGEEKYNKMSIFDVFKLKTNFINIMGNIKSESEYNFYMRKLFKRLARENLVGKNMRIPSYKNMGKFIFDLIMKQ